MRNCPPFLSIRRQWSLSPAGTSTGKPQPRASQKDQSIKRQPNGNLKGRAWFKLLAMLHQLSSQQRKQLTAKQRQKLGHMHPRVMQRFRGFWRNILNSPQGDRIHSTDVGQEAPAIDPFPFGVIGKLVVPGQRDGRDLRGLTALPAVCCSRQEPKAGCTKERSGHGIHKPILSAAPHHPTRAQGVVHIAKLLSIYCH